MRRHFLISFVCLTIGLLNYILFRPSIKLLDNTFFKYDVQWTMGIMQIPHEVSFIFSNYFGDFMWAIAVFQFSIASRKKELPFLYTFLLMTFPFLSELGQYFKFIDGTFDILDIFIYLVAFLANFKNYLWKNLKNIYLASAY